MHKPKLAGKITGTGSKDKTGVGAGSRRAPAHRPAKDTLLERIEARADAIRSRRGILPESYLLIREDRENR